MSYMSFECLVSGEVSGLDVGSDAIKSFAAGGVAGMDGNLHGV